MGMYIYRYVYICKCIYMGMYMYVSKDHILSMFWLGWHVHHFKGLHFVDMLVHIPKGYTHRNGTHMTLSTANATPPKSTISRNSNSSVQPQISSKYQFELVPRDTEYREI